MTKKDEIIQELQEKSVVDCEKLRSGDSSEIKEKEWEEIYQAIFENIKHHQEEWTIRKDVDVTCCGMYGKRADHAIIHKSVKINFNKEKNFYFVGFGDGSGYKIFDQPVQQKKESRNFSPQQWSELESTLQDQQQQTRVELTTKPWFVWGSNSNNNS